MLEKAVTEKAQREARARDKRALSILQRGVDDVNFNHLIGIKSAKQAWEILRKAHQSSDEHDELMFSSDLEISEVEDVNVAAVVCESNGADVNVVGSKSGCRRTNVHHSSGRSDASRLIKPANGSLMEVAIAHKSSHWTVGHNVVNVVEHAVKTKNEFKTETEEFLVTRKIEIAEKKKEEGNALFKAGEYAKASQRYEKGAKFIESVSDEEKSQSKALKTSCNLNNAAYKLKLKDYEQAKKLCTKVLDIDSRNVKALYRRAQAYLHLFNLEKAEIDIRKALEIKPDNREVKLEYKALKDKVKEYNKKDAKLYSNMFSKLTKLEFNEIPAGKIELKEDPKAKEATAIAELSSEEEQLEQLEAEKYEEVSEEKEAEKAKKQTVSDKLEDEGIKGNEDTVPMKDQEKAVEVVTAELSIFSLQEFRRTTLLRSILVRMSLTMLASRLTMSLKRIVLPLIMIF
ncbi:hypothetical protein Droror1_Dr00024139 [Drosera rotundifolia]